MQRVSARSADNDALIKTDSLCEETFYCRVQTCSAQAHTHTHTPALYLLTELFLLLFCLLSALFWENTSHTLVSCGQRSVSPAELNPNKHYVLLARADPRIGSGAPAI